jgi:hypothetical protein
MALREFLDAKGRAWRVWDVRPEQLHGAVRAEEYLQGFLDGWLVFESADGTERCRLYPIPRDWMRASVAELEQLRESAQTADREAIERGAADAPPHEPHSFGAMRTFHYPKGRYWTVQERPFVLRDSAGLVIETLTVLQFTSGSRHLELVAWPRNWMHLADEALADLLYRAFPRARDIPNPTPYRRRQDDVERRRGQDRPPGLQQ